MNISKAAVMTAAAALAEPLTSPVFYSFDLEVALECIESMLKKNRKRGFYEITRCGLAYAVLGPEWNLREPSQIFQLTNDLRVLLVQILDKVERNIDQARIEWARRVFASWQEHLPA